MAKNHLDNNIKIAGKRGIKQKFFKYVLFTIILGGIAVALYYDIFGVYIKYLREKRAEENLKNIHIGISTKYIRSIFGTPVAENYDSKSKETEYIYSFKRFYLQVVSDDSNKVGFYSVTIKNGSFHPEIPYVKNIIYFSNKYNKYFGQKSFKEISNMKLPQPNIGEKTFAELFSDDYCIIYSDHSSKFYKYAEKTDLAYPGNYHVLYLAYNPAGIDFTGKCFSSVLYVNNKPYPDTIESKKKIKKLRKNCMPNTYAVGIEGFNAFDIGIDFYLSRNLSEFE